MKATRGKMNTKADEQKWREGKHEVAALHPVLARRRPQRRPKENSFGILFVCLIEIIGVFGFAGKSMIMKGIWVCFI